MASTGPRELSSKREGGLAVDWLGGPAQKQSGPLQRMAGCRVSRWKPSRIGQVVGDLE